MGSRILNAVFSDTQQYFPQRKISFTLIIHIIHINYILPSQSHKCYPVFTFYADNDLQLKCTRFPQLGPKKTPGSPGSIYLVIKIIIFYLMTRIKLTKCPLWERKNQSVSLKLLLNIWCIELDIDIIYWV